MTDLLKIADEADLIVNGYAFKKNNMGYKVLNLNRPECAILISDEGEILETTTSDRKLTEKGSAKFFVKENGESVLQNRGLLNEREISKIQEFIRDNYKDMYLMWSKYSENEFYKGNN